MSRSRISLALALAAGIGASGSEAQTVAYVGATLWDGTGTAAVEDATLVVRDGRVLSAGRAAAPPGSAVVDLSDRWIMPGLIDAHVHVTGRWAPEVVGQSERARVEADLLLFARYGVTTVNSLGNGGEESLAVRDTQGGPDQNRARLGVAGPVVASPTPDDARAAVRQNADMGVDWIKIRVDDNLGTTAKMPWPAVDAVIDEAHRRGLRVASHLFYLEDAKTLLRSGTDLVAHSIRDTDVDDEVIGLLRDRGVCYVPTLTREVSTFVYAHRPAFLDDPFFLAHALPAEVASVTDPRYQENMRSSSSAARYREALEQAQRNLKALVDAGIPVAMGTDAGVAARFPGYFEHMELDLMVEAGLTPRQALASATSVAAACLGLAEVGTLEPGKWADFLVLGADPLADVSATKSLERVYIAGNEVR